jgi:hypothetical protein
MPKQSRLEVKKLWSGFQMVKNKMPAKNKMADHSKAGHKSVFRMFGPSLDHFLIEKGHKKNNLLYKTV